MKIVTAVRCLNEIRNIERFMRGYDFSDVIVVSDGGSTDGSLEELAKYPKVELIKFDMGEIINGVFWNMDAPHMNFVLDHAKSLDPDWIVFDDMDCVPNYELRRTARSTFDFVSEMGVSQINAFRLYLWGDSGEYFPKMNNYFDPAMTSLWAWQPNKIDIHADMDVRHGTLVGLGTNWSLKVPQCLLHRSWHPDTIDEKIRRYNTLGLTANHPLKFAGESEPLPIWATES